MQEYYIKNLTNIIPQKDYSSLYGERGFFIFSHDLSHCIKDEAKAREIQEFNRTVEQIFVFTAEEFIRRGEQDFIDRFGCDPSTAEESSMDEIYTHYRKKGMTR